LKKFFNMMLILENIKEFQSKENQSFYLQIQEKNL
jgi:hypothetical protein